ncbi:MAG: LysR family transcriptional regulator [Pseudonocardia sp.]|nr:LysR family transcriptional regulator [Pseudonocardia sp.]
MDASGLRLPWLASFLAVAEGGSMTAAATSLHLSQPRVSAHIASLETTVGAALFERRARGVTLTPLGQRLLPRARRIFDELQAAADDLDATRDRLEGKLRIGSYPGASAALIAPLLAQYRVRHPSVEVDLFEADAAKLDRAVLREQVDFAVRPADPAGDPVLSISVMCREKIVAVVPATDAPDPEAVADLSFVTGRTVVVSGDPQGGWADYQDRLSDVGAAPDKVIVATMPTTVTALVRAGLGYGILGAFAARAASGEGTLTLELPAPLWRREVRIVRAAGAASKPSRAFMGMLRRRGPSLTKGLAVW